MSANNSISQALAGRIRRHRLDRGLTQRQLAVMAQVAFDTYQRFERTGHISLGRLIRILDALGLADHLDHLAPTPRVVIPADGLVGRIRQRGRRGAPAPDAATATTAP